MAVNSLDTEFRENPKPFSEKNKLKGTYESVLKSLDYNPDKSADESRGEEIQRYKDVVNTDYSNAKNDLDSTSGALNTAMNTKEHTEKVGEIYGKGIEQAIKQGYSGAGKVVDSAIDDNNNISVAGQNLIGGAYTTEGTYGNANNRSYLNTLTAQRIADNLNNRLRYNPGDGESFATYSPRPSQVNTEEVRQMDTIRSRKQALDTGIINLQTGALSREWMLKKGLSDEQINFFNDIASSIGVENAANLVQLYITEYVGKAYERYAKNLDKLLDAKTSQQIKADVISNLSKLNNIAIKETLANAIGIDIPNYLVSSAFEAIAPAVAAAKTPHEKQAVILEASKELAIQFGVEVNDIFATMFKAFFGFKPSATAI